jgi:hypothetical protein
MYCLVVYRMLERVRCGGYVGYRFGLGLLGVGARGRRGRVLLGWELWCCWWMFRDCSYLGRVKGLGCILRRGDYLMPSRFLRLSLYLRYECSLLHDLSNFS